VSHALCLIRPSLHPRLSFGFRSQRMLMKKSLVLFIRNTQGISGDYEDGRGSIASLHLLVHHRQRTAPARVCCLVAAHFSLISCFFLPHLLVIYWRCMIFLSNRPPAFLSPLHLPLFHFPTASPAPHWVSVCVSPIPRSPTSPSAYPPLAPLNSSECFCCWCYWCAALPLRTLVILLVSATYE
jgi:hypothetical protein